MKPQHQLKSENNPAADRVTTERAVPLPTKERTTLDSTMLSVPLRQIPEPQRESKVSNKAVILLLLVRKNARRTRQKIQKAQTDPRSQHRSMSQQPTQLHPPQSQKWTKLLLLFRLPSPRQQPALRQVHHRPFPREERGGQFLLLPPRAMTAQHQRKWHRRRRQLDKLLPLRKLLPLPLLQHPSRAVGRCGWTAVPIRGRVIQRRLEDLAQEKKREQQRQQQQNKRATRTRR